MKSIIVDLTNIIKIYNDSEISFLEISKNKIIIKDALIINMNYKSHLTWHPNTWLSSLGWKLFRDSLLKDFYSNFKKAGNY